MRTKIATSLLGAIVLLGVTAHAQPPIPRYIRPTNVLWIRCRVPSNVDPRAPPLLRTYDGYRLGSRDAPLTLEVFFDLMCPDCRATW